MSEIVIENVVKTFSTKEGTVEALKGININIEKGDIFGIIGMSGAGKSTLVRCINHLEVPTSGEVYIQGQPLSKFSKQDLRKQREKIGMIFQHFNLLMQKSVIENVCFPMYIQGKKKKEAHEKAMEYLEIVGLADKAKAFPAQLSGGQKQRVAIARALASNPEILLCDEATSALDPQTTASILDLLKGINERFGITIVVITHQMAVVREICNRVAILSFGEVVEEGTVDYVFTHPKSQAAKELIRRDSGSDVEQGPPVRDEIRKGPRVRIVFTENSSFEPVISNLVLTFNEAVNIMKADTRNIGGIAKGEMILEFNKDSSKIEAMKAYLAEAGLVVEEVGDDVD